MDVPPLSSNDLIKYGLINYYDKLTHTLRKGLIRYTTSDYSTLNTLLRDGLNPNNSTHKVSYQNEIDWVNQLDKVITNAPKLSNPFHVYRGMMLPNLITDRIESQYYLNNFGYTSSSMSIDVACGFAGSSCCLFKIIVTDPNNLGYVYIKTKTKGEQELLFQRGTHFKLIGKPYKHKYYPKGSNKYEVITMYVVTIHPGILVPTRTITTRTLEELDPQTKILTSFTRYIETMEPEDIGMFYTSNYVEEIVDEYISTHKHYKIDNNIKEIMKDLVNRLL